MCVNIEEKNHIRHIIYELRTQHTFALRNIKSSSKIISYTFNLGTSFSYFHQKYIS